MNKTMYRQKGKVLNEAIKMMFTVVALSVNDVKFAGWCKC